MIKLIDFYGNAPQAYFFSAAACLITVVALIIITTPPLFAAAAITGAIFTIVPLMLALRTRRIEREMFRERELKRVNLQHHDTFFHEDHEKHDKYMKLRARLWDTGYPVNETLEKIRRLY